jgi:hypothetical protein
VGRERVHGGSLEKVRNTEESRQHERTHTGKRHQDSVARRIGWEPGDENGVSWGISPDMAGDHQQALDAVEHGVFNPRRMILHVLPQKEIGRGFELL